MKNAITTLLTLLVLVSCRPHRTGSGMMFETDCPKVNEAWELAVKTVRYNIRDSILAAGADYGGEWTRDVAINTWNGTDLFIPEVMLHVSRPVRWDSDHVTIMNDDTLELCKEIVRCDALDRVHIGLDYFDASINRIGAYVIGSRATQKCMMQALLEPLAKLRAYEADGQGFERLALLEESKSLPWNAVWDMFCLKNDVPVGEEFIADVQRYEAEVTSKR